MQMQLSCHHNIIRLFVPVAFSQTSDVISDVLQSPGKYNEFICGKLRSPDGAVMASLRRSPINGEVQFSTLSMLHLSCSAISIESNNNTSFNFNSLLFVMQQYNSTNRLHNNE